MTLLICLPTLYLFNLVFGARLSVRQALALVLVTITVTSMLTLAFAPISLFFLITSGDYSFYKVLNVGILALAAIVGLRFLTGGMAALNARMAAAHAAEAHATILAQQVPVQVEPVAEPELVAVAGNGVAPQGLPSQPPAMAVHAGAPAPMMPAFPGAGVQPLVPGPAYGPLGRDSRGRPIPLPGHQVSQLPPGERPASMGLLYIWILLFGFVGTQLAWTLRPFFGSPDEPFQLFREINGNFYVDIVRTIGHLF